MRVNGHKREHRLTLRPEDWDDDLERFYCGEIEGAMPKGPQYSVHINRVSRARVRTVAWERPTRLPRDVNGDPYLLRFMCPSAPLARPERHVHKWAYLGQADWPLPPHPECVCRHERRVGRVPAPGCPVHGGQK